METIYFSISWKSIAFFRNDIWRFYPPKKENRNGSISATSISGSAANEVKRAGDGKCLSCRVVSWWESERKRARAPPFVKRIICVDSILLSATEASVEMITAKRKSSQKRLAKAFSIASQLFLWIPIV